MTTPSLADSIKANATGMTLLGIAMLILGALALSAPLWTGVAVALMVGCLVLAAGIAQCAFSFQAGSFSQKLLGLMLGLLTGICGVVMIAHPVLQLSFLTLAMAVYFVVAGIFEVISALRSASPPRLGLDPGGRPAVGAAGQPDLDPVAALGRLGHRRAGRHQGDVPRRNDDHPGQRGAGAGCGGRSRRLIVRAPRLFAIGESPTPFSSPTTSKRSPLR